MIGITNSNCLYSRLGRIRSGYDRPTAQTTWNPFSSNSSFRPRAYTRLAGPLVTDLQKRLQTLQTALQKFMWPADLMTNNPRQIELDPRLQQKVRGVLFTEERAAPQYVLFSRGFDGEDRANLDDTTYTLDMTLGETTKTLSIVLDSSMSWKEVLEEIQDSVQESVLPVEADVVRQYTPFATIDNAPGVGYILAFRKRNIHDQRDLSLADQGQGLLDALNMKESTNPTGKATKARYSLSGKGPAEQSTYYSPLQDSQATTGLSAGAYAVLFTHGSDSETITITLEDNPTWEDTFEAVARGINGSALPIQGTIEQGVRPVYISDDRVLAEGIMLKIAAQDLKTGERMSISDSSGDLADTLGINGTAAPGRDGSLSIDGQTQTNSSSQFPIDRGRVLLELLDSFGDPLPLRIVNGYEYIRDNVSQIVSNYNDLLDMLVREEGFWQEDMISSWRQPYLSNQEQLEHIGFSESAKSFSLWVREQDFIEGLTRDSKAVEEVLVGAEGVFAVWENRIQRMFEVGLESYLLPVRVIENSSSVAEQELDLTKRKKLLDLLG